MNIQTNKIAWASYQKPTLAKKASVRFSAEDNPSNQPSAPKGPPWVQRAMTLGKTLTEARANIRALLEKENLTEDEKKTLMCGAKAICFPHIYKLPSFDFSNKLPDEIENNLLTLEVHEKVKGPNSWDVRYQHGVLAKLYKRFAKQLLDSAWYHQSQKIEIDREQGYRTVSDLIELADLERKIDFPKLANKTEEEVSQVLSNQRIEYNTFNLFKKGLYIKDLRAFADLKRNQNLEAEASALENEATEKYDAYKNEAEEKLNESA